MAQDFTERKPLENQHRQAQTFCTRRDQLPANATTRSQCRFHGCIADSYLSESPDIASLPETVRVTRWNIAGHGTYTDSALSLPANSGDFQRWCLRRSPSPSTSLFCGQRVRAYSGFWPESQRADQPGRMMFVLVAKTLFVFDTKANMMRRVQDHPQARQRGQVRTWAVKVQGAGRTMHCSKRWERGQKRRLHK